MFSEYNKERENIPKWLSFYSYDPVGSQWHHQWQNLGPSLNIDITQNEVQDFLKKHSSTRIMQSVWKDI